MPDANAQKVLAQLAASHWESRFLASKFLAGEPGKALYDSLSPSGRRRISNALIKRLDDDESRVRAQAAAALGRLECASARDALLTALADPNEWVRVQVGEALGHIGDQTLAPVVAQHLQTENDPHVRATLVKTLGIIGDEKMLPVLALFLDDVDGRVRANCVESLAQLNISESSRREAMFKLENDPSNRVQANVAISLVAMGEKRGREMLTRMVISRDEYMRASAAYALGQIRDVRDRPTLIRLLGDSSWLVRRNAVRSLVNFGFGDHARRNDLLVALQGNEVATRLGALEVIGALRMGSARGRVIGLLEDEAGEVRSKAEEVLDLLDGF